MSSGPKVSSEIASPCRASSEMRRGLFGSAASNPMGSRIITSVSLPGNDFASLMSPCWRRTRRDLSDLRNAEHNGPSADGHRGGVTLDRVLLRGLRLESRLTADRLGAELASAAQWLAPGWTKA